MDLSPRQAEFADAALRLVARDGLSAVTFRSLAAEAGMSLGAVQKAFPSKEQLLRAMFGRLRFPGQKRLAAARCPRCGRFRLGKGPCACGKGEGR